MNNKTIFWLIFILSWASVLFMKKDKVRRFMPAALFTAVSSGVIYQLGSLLGFWTLKDVIYSLLAYGPLPAVGMWVMRFTYEKFGLYIAINAIMDLGFAFVIFPWCGRIGVLDVYPWTGIVVYAINFFHAVSIYGYQMWQEGRHFRSK